MSGDIFDDLNTELFAVMHEIRTVDRSDSDAVKVTCDLAKRSEMIAEKIIKNNNSRIRAVEAFASLGVQGVAKSADRLLGDGR